MDFYTTCTSCNSSDEMEKHATDDGDKATYVMIWIQDRTSAAEYAKKHNFKNVYVVARPLESTKKITPTLKRTLGHDTHSRNTDTNCHIPHHVVIGMTERSRWITTEITWVIWSNQALFCWIWLCFFVVVVVSFLWMTNSECHIIRFWNWTYESQAF